MVAEPISLRAMHVQLGEDRVPRKAAAEARTLMHEYIRDEGSRDLRDGQTRPFACPDIRADVAIALRHPCEVMGMERTEFALRRLQPIADEILAHYSERISEVKPSRLMFQAAMMEARRHANAYIEWLATAETRPLANESFTWPRLSALGMKMLEDPDSIIGAEAGESLREVFSQAVQALRDNALPLDDDLEVGQCTSDYDRRKEELKFLLFGELPKHSTVEKLLAKFGDALNLGSLGTAAQVLCSAAAFVTEGPLASFLMLANSLRPSGEADKSSTERERYSRVHAAIKQESTADVQRMEASWRSKLESTDNEIDDFIRRDLLQEAATLMERRQGMLLGMPSEPRCLVACDGDNAADAGRIRRIDVAVEALLDDYAHIDGLRELIELIRDNSQTVGEAAQRVQLFIVGDAGVGKSRFVQKLADALELPMLREALRTAEDLNDIQPSLFDQQATTWQFTQKEVPDRRILTAIPDALLRAGCTNPVLFFDEAGELMSGKHDADDPMAMMRPETGTVARLKTVFDPDKKRIDSPWMASNNLSVDFGHAIVICAGNKAPQDKALRDRFVRIIHFRPMPKERKRQVAERKIRELANAVKNPRPAEVNRIVALASEHLDLLVNEDEAAQNAGVRNLLNAVATVVAKVRRGRQTGRDGKLSPGKVRNLVQRILRSDEDTKPSDSTESGDVDAESPQGSGESQ